MTSGSIVYPGKTPSPRAHLDLAREALVAQLRAAREVRLAALLDLGALELRETVVEDVALAVVALVRARLGEELVAPLPLGEALGLALGEDVRGPPPRELPLLPDAAEALLLGHKALSPPSSIRHIVTPSILARRAVRHGPRVRLGAPRRLGRHR